MLKKDYLLERLADSSVKPTAEGLQGWLCGEDLQRIAALNVGVSFFAERPKK